MTTPECVIVNALKVEGTHFVAMHNLWQTDIVYARGLVKVGYAECATKQGSEKIAHVMAAGVDMQNALIKLREAIEGGDPHEIAEALIRHGIPAINKSQGI